MSVAAETRPRGWAPPEEKPSFRSRIAAYYELTKPGITRLVLLTTGVGFYIASPAGGVDFLRLIHTLIGTVLAASGTHALNEYVERDIDRLMLRTSRRPLPSGRIRPGEALLFAASLAAVGIVYVGFLVNVTTAAVILASLVSYVFIYTPLKRRTSLCTLVGAVPGALPILAGWTATGRPIEIGAWILFAIVFLWQIPHFLALAWMFRDDYRNAGFVMISLDDVDGRGTGRQIFNYTAALLPVSLLSSAIGLTGWIYFAGALAIGAAFLAIALAALIRRDKVWSRRLFFASVLYLPAVLFFMVVDKALV
jgi:protoheme IX farnesyltransferase